MHYNKNKLQNHLFRDPFVQKTNFVYMDDYVESFREAYVALIAFMIVMLLLFAHILPAVLGVNKAHSATENNNTKIYEERIDENQFVHISN